MNEVLKRFWELCDQARYEVNVLNLYGTIQYELSLRKVLEHVKCFPSEREAFLEAFRFLEHRLRRHHQTQDTLDPLLRQTISSVRRERSLA